MLEEILTLADPFRYEPERTKGSRFVADLAPASTQEAALEFLASVRAEFPDASHHCFAWRLDPEGQQTRASDDGEPGGSAGRPILAQIEGHGVSGVICVVTRYFGGTKLGVGGLMRAYGGAAGQALNRAPLLQKAITETWAVRYPYGCSGAIEGVLHGLELELTQASYGEQVQGQVQVAKALRDTFLQQLQDRTGGKAHAEQVESGQPFN